ncbi:MAG: Gfo/Idh/MocA family oxidoreductase [Gemmatimonadetes bacterium]|uniref:Gfo/Idh/MocA family oxidoreductase n=1 Tax=Candidatus Kutchimonas denitrificans TaxID=3056748 RepID=A0AAE4ZCL2_9BACT|nr:Gfo/Idh/MocA family oxidoreductase [Gemmatimonadota bacterium]NIR75280.1 Gfo/Idh/MocA family oxidoreductase [Candidatus Kutchimonas denitrificans]NIS00218.1 Gfo/Idh/MocA family oxidoreductase [Gemmatimonadota bacterium]NIT65810.1 Gfo/Idh/MocA family oxidoreductase [Gemmatimonadota bacterium]NIU53088.1 Gfo/Idh/MocA family oxidoreductase [Gemmatimonadota bacterium]
MDPVAVGVLGVGSLGFHHARLLREIPEARLVGIYDIDDERAASVAEALDVPAYESRDKLFADVDALTIAVPTSKHFEVARSALEHECHLLIEKPITSTTDEADDLIRLANEKGQLIQVGHIERFNGAVRACEPYLDNPLFVESHRLAPFVPRGTDVPVVLDLMIHDIDLILSLVGRPVADARAAGVSVISGSVDIANARLEFDGGAVANITASRVSIGRQRKIRFFQPSGYVSLDLGNGTGEYYRRKPGSGAAEHVTQLGDLVEHISLRSDGKEPLRLELQAFVQAAAGEAAVPVTAEEGRAALAVALDIVDRIARHTKHVLDTNQARA